MTGRSLAVAALVLGLAAACRGTLSPLSNKINAGQEPFLVFVADGEDGLGDLFAAKPEGGVPYQVTFTRVDERMPALSPDGTMLAFVRGRTPRDSAAGAIVVMNLLNGAERKQELEGNPVDALAWSADGTRLFARRGEGILVLPAPPATGPLAPVSPGDAARADSAFRVLLGDPPLAEVVGCPDGAGLCARTAAGDVFPVSETASAPARWPGDSVFYVEGADWIVRPLAGGTARTIRWARPLAHPRTPTVVGKPIAPAPR